MTQEGQLPPPPVTWAQRRDIIYLTICLEDCKTPIELKPQMIYFKGVGGTEQKMHELTINLYGEIVPDVSLQSLKGRAIELILVKKEEGPYWPRLTKEKTKAHWLKSDFNKWKDEEDSDEAELKSNNDFEEMMRQMGRLGNSRDRRSFLDDLEENEGLDSDDDDLPDLE